MSLVTVGAVAVGAAAPSDRRMCRCPENLLAVADAPGAAAVLGRVQEVIFVMLTIAVAAMLAGRWRTATPLRRRAMALFVGVLTFYGAVAVLFGLVRSMASGLGNRAIAQRLSLSDRTVETHVKSIFRKLELPVAEQDNRRVRAVLAFLCSADSTGPC